MSRRRHGAVVLFEVVAGGALGLGAAWSWNPGVRAEVVAVDLSVGGLLVAGGVVASVKRPGSAAGPLLAAVGATWFAGSIWPALEFLHRGPLFHLVATYPSGRLAIPGAGIRGWIRATLVVAAYASNLTRIGGDSLVAAGFGMALLWLAWEIVVGTRGSVRRAALGAAAAGASIGLAVLASSVAKLAGTPLGVGGLFAYEAILALVGLGLAADLITSGWSSNGALTRAVVDLGDAALAGSVRDRLARSLGDPSLVLAYNADGQPGSYVDERGQPVSRPAPTAGTAVMPVVVAGRSIGFVASDVALLNESRLAESVSAAAGLAMSSARLQAEVRAQVAEVAASRERLVHAADSERRRLERRIQTGAALRLERVARLLAQVQLAEADAETGCAALRGELDRARDELADFARGVHPAWLTKAGLPAALAELVRRTPLVVELDVAMEPADPVTEATLYFVCSEAIANAAKHASPTRIGVELGQSDGALRLVVVDNGRGGARLEPRGGLRGLADRVEALGGTFGLESRLGAGTTIRVELPRHADAAGRS